MLFKFKSKQERIAWVEKVQFNLDKKFKAGSLYYHQILAKYLHKKSIVLDAGCGKNGILAGYKTKVENIIGVDLDQKSLDENAFANQKILSDLRDMPLNSDQVDFINSEFVLEHVSEPEKVISEFSRVLKPNGYLCFITPNSWHPVFLLSRLTTHKFHQKYKYFFLGQSKNDTFPTYYQFNTESKIKNILTKNNFEIKHIYKIGNPEYIAIIKPLVILAVLLDRFLLKINVPMYYLVLAMKKSSN